MVGYNDGCFEGVRVDLRVGERLGFTDGDDDDDGATVPADWTVTDENVSGAIVVNAVVIAAVTDEAETILNIVLLCQDDLKVAVTTTEWISLTVVTSVATKMMSVSFTVMPWLFRLSTIALT